MNNIESLRIHLVGIGGIGMSGLAQMLAAAGHRVSGSDRACDKPENAAIFDALRSQGIRLYPQDGSYFADGAPDMLIYSTAIEEDNPDFKVAPNVKRVHRAAALQDALLHWPARSRIAVTGSAGKTTTSAWLGETLFNLDVSPSILSGGLLNRFRVPGSVGNFVCGNGDDFVFEADESDKSLLRYRPEYAMVLNIGTDHYSREELIEVFAEFLSQTRKGAVLEYDLLREIPENSRSHLVIRTFSANHHAADFSLIEYHFENGYAGMTFRAPTGEFKLRLPSPGHHNAANALAILAMLDLLGFKMDQSIAAVENFSGAWRRFDFAGVMSNGAKVFDDYAHNIEKMCSAIRTARETIAENGHLLIVFQPHGFGPFNFMREALPDALKQVLSNGDMFLLLPVFYAGGTSSFKPTSTEVAAEINVLNPVFKCIAPENRAAAESLIHRTAVAGDCVLVMGARDNSLSDWAAKLTKG